MAKSPGPDPRFDPRFQRGYDGPEPDAPATPAMPSPIDPAGPPRIPTGSASAGVVRDGDVSDLAAPAARTEADAVWAPPRRNPFALALLLGSLAMIGVGFWLFWTVVTASTFPNGIDQAAQTFSLFQQQATPALLIAGVLGIIIWLVLGAVAASNRRGG